MKKTSCFIMNSQAITIRNYVVEILQLRFAHTQHPLICMMSLSLFCVKSSSSSQNLSRSLSFSLCLDVDSYLMLKHEPLQTIIHIIPAALPLFVHLFFYYFLRECVIYMQRLYLYRFCCLFIWLLLCCFLLLFFFFLSVFIYF